jgi:hypothetical protein
MTTEKITEIQKEAQAIFKLIQQLQAPMTENNIAVLNACLGSLKLIGRMLEEEKKAAEGENEDDGDVKAE